MKRYGLEQILLECPINIVDSDSNTFTICFESGLFIIRNSDGEDVTGSMSGMSAAHLFSVLTNGDGSSPELIFDSDGDVIMTEQCNGSACS